MISQVLYDLDVMFGASSRRIAIYVRNSITSI